MINAIENNFSIIIALAFVSGLLLPDIAKTFYPYILYFLMGIMFLTMLKIDLSDLTRTASQPVYIGYLTFVILILTPILLYVISMAVYPNMAPAMLIVGSLPAAMSSTSITDLLKGNVHVALLLTVVTSILAPLTMPFLIKTFIGVETQASFFDMLITLAKIIFIPFGMSILAKKTFKKAIERTKGYYAVINIFLLYLIIVGLIGHNADYMLDNLELTIKMSIYFFILASLQHIVGWYSSINRPRGDRIASATIIFYCNTSLGVVFASKFFSPYIVLAVVLYNVPWSIMPMPFQYCIKKFT